MWEISKTYKNLAKIFLSHNVNILSSHRDENDLMIKLKKKKSFFDLFYNFSRNELKTLREYLNTHMQINFIRLFKSFTEILVFFDNKKSDNLRLCVNYRNLNRKIVKNQYSLLLIKNLLHQLAEIKIFM